MARTIDANELMVEIQVCSWDSEQDKERAEDLVLGMPTLTPPNEPLTLEELREMGVDVPADVYTIPYAVKTILAAKARRDAGETLVLPRNENTQEGGAAGC